MIVFTHTSRFASEDIISLAGVVFPLCSLWVFWEALEVLYTSLYERVQLFMVIFWSQAHL